MIYRGPAFRPTNFAQDDCIIRCSDHDQMLAVRPFPTTSDGDFEGGMPAHESLSRNVKVLLLSIPHNVKVVLLSIPHARAVAPLPKYKVWT